MSGHEVSRRTFIQVSGGAGAGLVLGFSLVGCRRPAVATGALDPGALNAWIRIGTDESVTFVISESEMGQGVHTALAMLLAEELEVDWSRVRTEHAPADRTRYGRQSTGGSTSIRTNHIEPSAVSALPQRHQGTHRKAGFIGCPGSAANE